ncbi:hypothetical protein VTL71DRAFT_6889 [Oculimacula yallundae]|uniref:Uncharacterized protein n=1 Tax=Oculimacula yallundae TaxID=86028 RepID=A0ABR4BV64_9HELO
MIKLISRPDFVQELNGEMEHALALRDDVVAFFSEMLKRNLRFLRGDRGDDQHGLDWKVVANRLAGNILANKFEQFIGTKGRVPRANLVQLLVSIGFWPS